MIWAMRGRYRPKHRRRRRRHDDESFVQTEEENENVEKDDKRNEKNHVCDVSVHVNVTVTVYKV